MSNSYVASHGERVIEKWARSYRARAEIASTAWAQKACLPYPAETLTRTDKLMRLRENPDIHVNGCEVLANSRNTALRGKNAPQIPVGNPHGNFSYVEAIY